MQLGDVYRHPFDASKWGRIQKFLADEGVLNQKRIVEPVEATTDDLLVVFLLLFYLSFLSTSCEP